MAIWRGIQVLSRESRVAAKYSYPYGRPAFDNEDFQRIDFPRIIRVLRENRVLLTCYENLLKSPREDGFMQLKTLLRSALDEESKFIIDSDFEMKKLDNFFRRNGISYMLPKFTFFHREQNDVDVLVSTADFGKVVNLLQSERYQVTSIQSLWKVTLAKWIEGRRNSVHVHSRVHWYTWDPFEFVPSANLWRRAQLIDLDDQVRVLIPCAEDCVLVLAAHAMIENREVSLADVFQLYGIVRNFPDVNWSEATDIAYERGWCYDLLAFLGTVNKMSSSLYEKLIVPETFFSYAEKKITFEERLLRRIAGETTTFSIPWRYSFAQRGLTFVKVFLRNYQVGGILKIARGFAHRTAYVLRHDKGE